MQTERQLTSKLPWIETFSTSIEEKFNEIDSALDLSESNRTEIVYLTREAVEEIAFNETTPLDISGNFIQCLNHADDLKRLGVHPFNIVFVLTLQGLKVLCSSKGIQPSFEFNTLNDTFYEQA